MQERNKKSKAVLAHLYGCNHSNRNRTNTPLYCVGHLFIHTDLNTRPWSRYDVISVYWDSLWSLCQVWSLHTKVNQQRLILIFFSQNLIQLLFIWIRKGWFSKFVYKNWMCSNHVSFGDCSGYNVWITTMVSLYFLTDSWTLTDKSIIH